MENHATTILDIILKIYLTKEREFLSTPEDVADLSHIDFQNCVWYSSMIFPEEEGPLAF